ncbi:DNA repair protein RecO [Oricola cellulosilytica]|uniref:DNA repair protein RecO n=1 Tax=Oricola cellulosilytica TaxID=1429082 RepID=A0A4R0PDE3_9HYPH|nr:DNA repair protein RecO [Oricola cellulosilytica]TCD14235.1 DNA repair protein RecO [Oricola cellulosilytica]
MEWHDHGIIIGTRRHGETSLILEVMTERRGRHLGLVRGGRSRKLQPLLQPGNAVDLTWRARLEEHLGTYQVEPVALSAARLMDHSSGVYGIQLLGSHLRLLPERDRHSELYRAMEVVIEHLCEPQIAGPLMVRFELRLLEELGFGLDLSSCAGTGVRNDLVYVSPKTGRAVSRLAGEPWKDKLLALPPFLAGQPSVTPDRETMEAGFRLTTYFLHRHVYDPRGAKEPDERTGFVSAVLRAMDAGEETVA